MTIAHEITAVIHEAAHKGLFSLLGTLDAIERNPGRKTSLAREAIALYEAGSAGTKSGGEVQTVALFDAQGLPRPLVNTKLLGEEVDFHWPDRKLVIELDGSGHGRAPTRRDDARRDHLLRDAGWDIQRAREPADVVERFRQWGWRKLPRMIDRAPFGATGHESSRVIFGAAALGDVSKADADRTLELLLEHGINHIDVAASYGDAELRIATWLKEHPFFVATKTGQRTYAAAREEIRRSLERLGVDHVDSIQLHNLCDVIEWDTALSPGGALEACVEAREEGLVNYIGVTGHGLSIPKMHQRSLERFDFDSVLCPYNFVQMQDPRYAETFDQLAVLCAEKRVALQTIKSLARAPWEGREHTAATWYEPLTDQADIDQAVHWVLGNEQVFLLTTGDVAVLPKLLAAAERYATRPSDDAMAAIDTVPLFT